MRHRTVLALLAVELVIGLWLLAPHAFAQTLTATWDDPAATGADVEIQGHPSILDCPLLSARSCRVVVPAVGPTRVRLRNEFGAGAWSAFSTPTSSQPAPGESADGTTVSTISGFIRDNNANLWTLENVPGAILRNGTHSGGAGSKLKYVSRVVYTLGLDGNWWKTCGLIDCWSFFSATEPGTPTAPPPPPTGSTIFSGGFESGDFSAYSFDSEGAGPMTQTVVSSPTQEGSFAARFTLGLPSTDFGIMRNEIMAGEWTTSPGIGAAGQIYTYTFSHFIPSTWPDTNLPVEVAQFHVAPDPGEAWRAPVLAFFIRNGAWVLQGNWDDRAITPPADWRPLDYGTTSLEKGQWTTWRVEVRWAWDSSGFLKIWKNGQQVLDRTGPNAYNDINPRVFKWGIYTRSDWAPVGSFPVANYELFLDNFTAELGASTPPPPPPTEICGDGIDNDKDGLIDEACTAPPPPPPPDVCVTDPLVVSRISWPSANSGRRSLTFDTGTKTWVSFALGWRDDGHHVLIVKDSRGCEKQVTR